MRMLLLVGPCLAIAACSDDHAREAAVTTRCETLLAAQERAGLPPALRSDPRAPIRPRDEPDIHNSDGAIFVRRSYDRLVPAPAGSRIERRVYSCTFDEANGRIATLLTDGHRQEFRLNEDEFAIMQRNATGH